MEILDAYLDSNSYQVLNDSSTIFNQITAEDTTRLLSDELDAGAIRPMAQRTVTMSTISGTEQIPPRPILFADDLENEKGRAMVRREIDEYGEEEVSSKKAAHAHRKSDHKHTYAKALLRRKSVSESTGKVSEFYDVGKYCTICGRAVHTTYDCGMVQKPDGFWRWIEPRDFPDLPVVDVEERGGRGAVYRTVQDPGDI